MYNPAMALRLSEVRELFSPKFFTLMSSAREK
jgi:hypothetical protein